MENSPTQPASPWSGATHAVLHAARAEVPALADVVELLGLDRPGEPGGQARRLSASGSSIGSSIRGPPSRLSDERAERFGSAENRTRSTASTRKAEAVRSSSASSSGTISDERDSVRVAS